MHTHVIDHITRRETEVVMRKRVQGGTALVIGYPSTHDKRRHTPYLELLGVDDFDSYLLETGFSDWR